MKKLVATLLVLLTTVCAYALPVGNLWDASLLSAGLLLSDQCQTSCDPCSNGFDALSLRIGFYGDYVFNRHTQINEKHRHESIHSTKLFTNAG